MASAIYQHESATGIHMSPSNTYLSVQGKKKKFPYTIIILTNVKRYHETSAVEASGIKMLL